MASNDESTSPSPPPPTMAEDTDTTVDAENTHASRTSTPPTILPSPAPPAPRPEPAHHCFICLVDEGEEGDVSDWVNPCPCTLEAHHACLLRWIDESDDDTQLVCPQCKAPIRTVGAYDRAIALSERIRKALGNLSPVFVGSSLLSVFGVGQVWYGQMAAGIFFDGRYPRVVALNTVALGGLSTALGYATIMPTLIVCHVFPGFSAATAYPFSLLYLSSQIGAGRHAVWPPDPDLAFACIPCLAFAYRSIWRKMFGRMEKRWDSVLYGIPEDAPEPRNRGLRDILGAVVDDLGGNDEPRHDGHEVVVAQEGNVEVVIEFENMADQAEAEAAADDDDDNDSDDEMPGLLVDEDGEARPPAPAEAEAGPIPRPAPAAARARARQGGQGQQNRRQENQRGEGRAPTRYPITSVLIQMSVALAFPSICYACGELLRLALPKSQSSGGIFSFWPSSGRPGLLQQTWGRSFVGGCMFMVMKDMFQLYVKYRRAAIKPLRRIPSVPRRRATP